MIEPAPIPSNEAERLEALDSYQLLDAREAAAYEPFIKLAQQVSGAPIAAISLVDEHRQWFKSYRGIDVRETPREVAFCSYVVASGEPAVVTDASADPRFRENPLVKGEPHVRFYAGVPLTTPSGYTIGTLCVMDHAARTITQAKLNTLRLLADALMNPLEARKRFLSLIDAAHVDLFVVNAKSLTIFFASRGACERLGYSIAELVGMSVYDVIPNLTGADVRDIIARGRKREEVVREVELVRRDGRSYPVELRIDVSEDAGEERLHAIALEVTQRKAQEREIALLLGAMNAAGDVILVYTVAENGELVLSYANDAFVAQAGYTPEESIGRELAFFRKGMPDDDGMQVAREAVASGMPAQAEIASYRKDGSTYWNQVSLHPIRNAAGSVTHWISIERDITADVERTSALAEEHDRLLLLTRAARRLFTTLDTTSVVSTVREVTSQLLGTEARVLAVDDDGICVGVDELGSAIWDRGRADSLVERAVKERVRVVDDGAMRTIAYSGRFGEARYVLEMRPRAGRTLRNTDLFVFDLIAEYFAVALRNVSLYHEVEERRSAVLELNQTKSDLIAMLAHDFRGPLTSIVGFADLTSEVGDVNDEQRDFLETIKGSALQLSELATDTLTLSRLERNEVVLQLGEVDLAELLDSIVTQQKDRRTVALLIEGDVHITGDQDRLRQVFSNLIDNAIKYTPEGPDPAVTATGGRETVTIVVRDYGIGIPLGELSRVFDRFTRASNARKMRISGTGFGLFLTKQLVQLHGGTIAVESEEGNGSTFTVVLPRKADRRFAPRTILLLDPERDRSFLAYGLQEAGYRVLAASSIEEVLATADAQPFDAVVLSAPDTLSNKAAVQFRAFSRERNVPLIAIGSGVPPRLGASVTLSRPAVIGDVIAALERLLGNARAPKP
ncbi:MAG TPA: ATP-binding protein [Candidatus Baltobacteraceae bacterium]|nr:ATP-binding protein [Candidatus Baltobacteraceae bacterium]